MSAKVEREWDVRNGGVYRDGQMIASFSEYRQAHPSSALTVEQWEDRKWRQVHRLAYGTSRA